MAFVGRLQESGARLVEMLATQPVVVVWGAAGSGKTALVLHVASTGIGLPPAIRISLGGVGEEREINERLAHALGTPASGEHLIERLCEHPRLVILDDADLGAGPTVGFVRSLSARSGAARFVVVSQSIAPDIGWPSFEVPPLSAEDAESLLLANPDSPDALMLACRLRVGRGDGAGALALLRTHLAARAGVSSNDLERILRTIAAATPTFAVEALLLLAREQLRWGDIQASERTLGSVVDEDLEPSTANRFHALRAAALFRLGEVFAANAELSIARRYDPPEEDVAVELATAELAIARGRLVPARHALLELGERTSKHPRLATRRAYAMGASYYFEGRHPLAIAWAKRARAAAGRRRDPLLILLEVAARLGCDQVDRARVLERSTEHGASDDEPFGRGVGVLMSSAILWRRGELAKALVTAEPTLVMLSRRADQVSRAVVSHFLALCAIGLGRFDQAEDLLRVFSGVATEPGFALLAPLCHLDHAALAMARGDRDEASRCVHLALEGAPRFPLARIEARALSDDARALDMSGESDAAVAFATLRAAERDLDRDALATAERRAREAERHYRRMDVRWELARSLLVIAESGVRRHERANAATSAIRACEIIAEPMGYVPILVALALLRASLGDRSGDLDAYAAQLAHAFAIATPSLRDRSLANALARVGFVVPQNAITSAHPLRALIERLGLARSRVAFATEGALAFLLGSDDPMPDVDLLLDVGAGVVRAGNATRKLSPIPLRILERIASGGAAGSTPEEIYLTAWGVSYHPLRHRNTLYVALNRLRATLKPLVGEEAIVEQGDGHYRLRAGLRVATRHELADDGTASPASFPPWQRAVAASKRLS